MKGDGRGKNSPHAWRWAEDEVILKRYRTIGAKKCLPLLPGRTWRAIKNRASILGVRVEKVSYCAIRAENSGRGLPWTKVEDAVLLEFYPKGGASCCTKRLPGRTEASIYIRATRRLGLHVIGSTKSATQIRVQTEKARGIFGANPVFVPVALEGVMRAWSARRTSPRINSISDRLIACRASFSTKEESHG